jgi:hypothetical protein
MIPIANPDRKAFFDIVEISSVWFLTKKPFILPTVCTFGEKIMMYNLLSFGHAKKKRKGGLDGYSDWLDIGRKWCIGNCCKNPNRFRISSVNI